MKFLICYGNPGEDLELVEAPDAETAARDFLETRDQHNSIEVYALGAGARFAWSRTLERKPLVEERPS